MKKINGKKPMKAVELNNQEPVQSEHDRLMEEFLAKGGKVQVIPSGISGAEYYGVPAASNWKKKGRKSY